MQILRVQMDQLSTRRDEIPEEEQVWAGRGLTSRIVHQEVPPTCDPLGPLNKLVIANGFLAGTNTSSAGRLSVGTKSPLTGGIKESNAGGTAGDAMGRLGLRAIVVESVPANGGLHLLKVGKDSAELIPADEYRGLGTYALCEKLYECFGKRSAIICIGPAGEHRLASAGTAVCDKEGMPSRYAGRGGTGAVMGSKGLKAIVLDDIRAEIPMHDREAFRAAQKRYTACLLAAPLTSKEMPELGTLHMIDNIHWLGGVPTRNFREGTFDEHYPRLTAETLRDTMRERGGEGTPTHACMPGCIPRCSNVFADAQGKTIVSPLEYENLVLLGPNLGIFSVDEIARLNYLCNDCGVDTIEAGAAIGVAMEAGLLPFGDFAGAARLLDEVAQGTLLGRVIGQGAAVTGRVFGVSRVPVAKGQALPAYDPRAVKGLGVTYATSTMGADHTAGHTIMAKVDHHLPDGQVPASRVSQLFRPAYDSINLCAFATGPLAPTHQITLDMVNAMLGTSFDLPALMEMGRQITRMERDFNKAAGLSSADDRLPEFFRTEPLPPFGTVFDVPQEELEHIFDELDD